MSLAEIAEIAGSFWVVWLMILFGAVVFWAFRPANKGRFEDDARIPFRNGE